MSNDKNQPTARLVGFSVQPAHPLPPPLHRISNVNFDTLDGQLDGWGVEIRGATMFLVSPPGWKHGMPSVSWRKDGERTLVGPISLAHVTLFWKGASAEAVDKCARYSLPEMRVTRPAPESGPAIPPSQMGDP
jgi:hypothetical protein